MTTIQRMLTGDGKPFFPIGGQVHNSSAYTMEGLEPAWQALKRIGGAAAMSRIMASGSILMLRWSASCWVIKRVMVDTPRST